MPSRADSLSKGSFRGVPFYYLDAGGQHGRRGQLHEYPRSDDHYFEDLGLKTAQYTLDIFQVGDDWNAQRKALIAAFETKGPGTLVHPTDGRMQVNCTDVRRQETVTQLGLVNFSVTFIPTGSQPPAAERDTGGDLDTAAGTASAASSSAFSRGFSLTGLTGVLQSSALGSIGGALDAVKNAVGFARGAIAGASQWVSFAATSIGTVRSVVNDVGSVLGSGVSLVGSTIFDPQLALGWLAGVTATESAGTLLATYPDLGTTLAAHVSDVSGLYVTGSGDPFQGWAQQRRAGPARTILRASSTDTASAPMVTATTGGYSATTLATVFNVQMSIATALARPAVSLPASPTASQLQAVASTNAVYDVMRQAALIEAAGALSATGFTSRTQGLALRDQLAAALQAEADLATDGATVRALLGLRLAMARDVAARTAGLPDAITLTLPASIPALVLAQRLYGSPSLVPDMVARNDLRHPLFVPAAVPIEVLANG